MAIDSLDNIYALIRNKNWDDENDLSTARIDKYTSSGVLIASIPLSNDKKSRQIGGDPRAIDVDGEGNIWVVGAMGFNSTRVWGYLTKYDPNGVVLAEWELPSGIGEYSGYTPNWWEKAQYYYWANNKEGVLGVPTAISVYGGKAYVLRGWLSKGPPPHQNPKPTFLGKWDAIHNLEFPYPECQIGFPVEVYSTATGAQVDSWYALGGEDIEVNGNGVYVVGHKTFLTKYTREKGTNKVGDADASLQYIWDDPIDENNDGIPDVRYGPDCGGQAGKYSHGGSLQAQFAPRKIYCDESTVATPAALGSDADGNIYVVGAQEYEPSTEMNYWGYVEKNVYTPFSGVKKYSADGEYLGTTMSYFRTREDHIKCTLRKILAKPELTSNIKLGFQIFSKEPKMLTGVSSSGASEDR